MISSGPAGRPAGAVAASSTICFDHLVTAFLVPPGNHDVGTGSGECYRGGPPYSAGDQRGGVRQLEVHEYPLVRG
jgi:hypothetical protein